MGASWRTFLVTTLCPGGCLAKSVMACDEPGAAADGYAEDRREMVARQLKFRSVGHAKVLEAMGRVPRHEFLPHMFRSDAYADRPLPIGHDQTISQPYIVAFMTEALDPKPADRVLEIGTGSGYQAAILAGLVAQVCTIEIVAPLGERARNDLERLGYRNVCVRVGDGYEGWPAHAPFDAIIVTCAPKHVPQPLVGQLRDGGRMIIPVGDSVIGKELVLLEKRGGQLVKRDVMPVRFVPMTGKAQKRRK